MVWSATVTRENGEMHVGGVSVTALAKQHQTALYVVDELDMRHRARQFVTAFTREFAQLGTTCDVYYASKALLSSQIADWMRQEGLCLDVASGGELEIALRGGVPAAQIGLHGNNKSRAELTRALEVGVGRIIVDSLAEIELLQQLAASLSVSAPVLIRVTTGVHAGGHDYIATSHEDQKFGISIATGAALTALQRAAAAPNLELMGIHTHIGSQIVGLDAFAESATRMLQLRADFFASSGIELPEVDLGGGFGIAYLPEDTPVDIESAAVATAQAVQTALAQVGGSIPKFSIEPGRAIAGPAGLTLYEVGVVKPVQTESGLVRHYISVDGGMSDNMRTITYGAKYHVELANRVSAAPPVTARVVGKHCESGDVVVADAELPGDIQPGDLLAVAATGAYGRALSNNYNFVPRPAVVAVAEGKSKVLIRRDTISDFFALDQPPS